jgi:hypothetical protein
MERMMHKLTQQERLFPDIPMICYLKDECQRDIGKMWRIYAGGSGAPEGTEAYQYTALT